MAKKHSKAHDTSQDEDDDPDAGVSVDEAPPARSKASRGAKAHGAKAHGDAGHGAKAHGDHDGAATTEDEARDPSWWVPYAALGVLVLVGVLGFFGTFNRWLKPMFSPMPASSAVPAETAHAAAPPPPTPVTNRPPPQLPADTFGAKHLLVMYKGSRRAPASITRTKEEALARAKEALAKAKAPGAKFEDVVAEYSDEPRAAERGGNLGNFRRGAMVKEFQEGLEKTKVGAISDIVETPFGYHVILRTR
jgi:hypothetical protein